MSILATLDQGSFLTLVFTAAILGLILFIKSAVWPSYPVNIPPFPEKPYPLLGHIPYVSKGLRKKIKEWRKSTGEIFSLCFGPRLYVVINGHKLVKEALVKNADTMSSRPPLYHVKDHHIGLVFSNGALWKEQRSVSLSILRSFGMGKTSLASKISEEVSVYLDTLTALDGRPKDVGILTESSVSNVICSIIVGKRFDYEDPFFTAFLESFREMMIAAASVNPVVIWPWLRFIPGNFMGSKTGARIGDKILSQFCDRFIELTQAKDGNHDTETFITSYLEEMKRLQREGKETTLSTRALRRTLLHLFLAGTDTTSTTILWFMIFMLRHPEIQRKVYLEITDTIGTERMPEIQDRLKLPYLQATVMETQRLASIVPNSVAHYCIADTTIAGYTIPANTTVLPSLDSVLLDETIWEEPTTFRPERFLDGNGDLVKHDNLIPFSIGRRVCLGEGLASMELFLYISSLVQRFELWPAVTDQPPALDYVEGVVCAPQTFEVRFVERIR